MITEFGGISLSDEAESWGYEQVTVDRGVRRAC